MPGLTLQNVLNNVKSTECLVVRECKHFEAESPRKLKRLVSFSPIQLILGAYSDLCAYLD